MFYLEVAVIKKQVFQGITFEVVKINDLDKFLLKP